MNNAALDKSLTAKLITQDIKALLLSSLSKVSHNLKFNLASTMANEGLMLTNSELYLIKHPGYFHPADVEVINRWSLRLIEIDSQRGNIAKQRSVGFSVDNDELLTEEGKSKISQLLESWPVEVNFDFIRALMTSNQAILIFNNDIHLVDSIPTITTSNTVTSSAQLQERSKGKSPALETIEFEAWRTAYVSKQLAL
jgi:hypothetical protein